MISSQPGVGGAERPEGEIAAALVRRIRSGDRHAESELVERYSRGLLFFLRRTTRSLALSDDLHQETFRIALERLRRDGLSEPEKLSSFLLGTARNLFLGDYRKRARRGEDLDSEPTADAPDPRPGQLDAFLSQEQAASVQRLIAELPTDRDRQILLRFYVAEEDKESICADLGLSSLHFNRVLFRARQRFKELLEQNRGSAARPTG